MATAITVAIIGTIFILLNLSFVQNSIRKKIVADLSQKLHTRVEIGTLSFFPFSELKMGDVYLEDQTRDTLFTAHQMKVHLDFWRLFRKEVAINSADLTSLNFNLKVDSTGKTNFDFVIKAFASK
ncbi:MAG: AsmA family protein, partial [Bacteroidota bacterium]|nr:AsmA family protein [Bacteroidota bacterium]